MDTAAARCILVNVTDGVYNSHIVSVALTLNTGNSITALPQVLQ
jgi:hypothetical protein